MTLRLLVTALVLLASLAPVSAAPEAVDSLPAAAAGPSDVSDWPEELRKLARQNELTPRALRAFGLLPDSFVRLALESRAAGLDLLAIDTAGLSELTESLRNDTEHALSPRIDDIQALAALLDAYAQAAALRGPNVVMVDPDADPGALEAVWLEEVSFYPLDGWEVERWGRMVEMVGPEGTHRILVAFVAAESALPTGGSAVDDSEFFDDQPTLRYQMKDQYVETEHVVFLRERPDGTRLRVRFISADSPISESQPLLDVFLLGMEFWQRPPDGWRGLPLDLLGVDIDPLADLDPAAFDHPGAQRQ